jgi:beta-glucosidase
MIRRRTLNVALLLFVTVAGLSSTAIAEEPQHAAVKPEPRNDAGWMKRHESFNERVKQGDVGVIFIGDSITQGWEGAGAKEIWDKHFGPRKPVNLGIGGDRTQHVLWRLDNGNIDGIQPKAAVIMIGTNNAGANNGKEIADGIAAIVKKLNEKLPETKVLILGIFPRGAGPDDAGRKITIEANQHAAKLADGKTVYYLDISDKFLSPDGTLSKEIMPDLLHLSPKGYQIWADSIEDSLAMLLEENK